MSFCSHDDCAVWNYTEQNFLLKQDLHDLKHLLFALHQKQKHPLIYVHPFIGSCKPQISNVAQNISFGVYLGYNNSHYLKRRINGRRRWKMKEYLIN